MASLRSRIWIGQDQSTFDGDQNSNVDEEKGFSYLVKGVYSETRLMNSNNEDVAALAPLDPAQGQEGNLTDRLSGHVTTDRDGSIAVNEGRDSANGAPAANGAGNTIAAEFAVDTESGQVNNPVDPVNNPIAVLTDHGTVAGSLTTHVTPDAAAVRAIARADQEGPAIEIDRSIEDASDRISRDLHAVQRLLQDMQTNHAAFEEVEGLIAQCTAIARDKRQLAVFTLSRKLNLTSQTADDLLDASTMRGSRETCIDLLRNIAEFLRESAQTVTTRSSIGRNIPEPTRTTHLDMTMTPAEPRQDFVMLMARDSISSADTGQESIDVSEEDSSFGGSETIRKEATSSERHVPIADPHALRPSNAQEQVRDTPMTDEAQAKARRSVDSTVVSNAAQHAERPAQSRSEDKVDAPGPATTPVYQNKSKRTRGRHRRRGRGGTPQDAADRPPRVSFPAPDAGPTQQAPITKTAQQNGVNTSRASTKGLTHQPATQGANSVAAPIADAENVNAGPASQGGGRTGASNAGARPSEQSEDDEETPVTTGKAVAPLLLEIVYVGANGLPPEARVAEEIGRTTGRFATRLLTTEELRGNNRRWGLTTARLFVPLETGGGSREVFTLLRSSVDEQPETRALLCIQPVERLWSWFDESMRGVDFARRGTIGAHQQARTLLEEWLMHSHRAPLQPWRGSPPLLPTALQPSIPGILRPQPSPQPTTTGDDWPLQVFVFKRPTATERNADMLRMMNFAHPHAANHLNGTVEQLERVVAESLQVQNGIANARVTIMIPRGLSSFNVPGWEERGANVAQDAVRRNAWRNDVDQVWVVRATLGVQQPAQTNWSTPQQAPVTTQQPVQTHWSTPHQGPVTTATPSAGGVSPIIRSTDWYGTGIGRDGHPTPLSTPVSPMMTPMAHVHTGHQASAALYSSVGATRPVDVDKIKLDCDLPDTANMSIANRDAAVWHHVKQLRFERQNTSTLFGRCTDAEAIGRAVRLLRKDEQATALGNKWTLMIASGQPVSFVDYLQDLLTLGPKSGGASGNRASHDLHHMKQEDDESLQLYVRRAINLFELWEMENRMLVSDMPATGLQQMLMQVVNGMNRATVSLLERDFLLHLAVEYSRSDLRPSERMTVPQFFVKIQERARTMADLKPSLPSLFTHKDKQAQRAASHTAERSVLTLGNNFDNTTGSDDESLVSDAYLVDVYAGHVFLGDVAVPTEVLMHGSTGGRPGPDGRPVRYCYNCGGPGHISRECTQAQQGVTPKAREGSIADRLRRKLIRNGNRLEFSTHGLDVDKIQDAKRRFRTRIPREVDRAANIILSLLGIDDTAADKQLF